MRDQSEDGTEALRKDEKYHALVKVISGTAILVESSVIVAYGICVRPGTVPEDVG